MILFLVLSALTGCISYNSLEKAIQSKWKYPIKILYADENKRTVIFLDQSKDKDPDRDQYIFNTFKMKNSQYRYSTDREECWTFTADNGLTPFLCRSVNTEEAGNVIWGAIKTDKHVQKVLVTYADRSNPDNQIEVEIPVVNNVFIGYPKDNFFNSETSLYREWKIKASAIDDKGNIIATSGN
ncbi:hypothetical protein QFZ77_004709 [Paenibacillus sp. V4I3]|uniref:hypothetical protein n=1 Tax=Paenibacillus sp. V4I3 TaxID=3042305 RepID=UPI002789CB04|nr:hypothetical protein [Paenibacillus sp. V4I3]MDQ0876050.1 hypothetical protein [Paenibacillus sp. V4I3]